MARVLNAALVLACGAATSLALTGGPAAAATAASKRVPGAYASITSVTWADQALVHFKLTVKDTSADGIHAEGQVQERQGMTGKVITFRAHKAVGKGHVYYDPKAYVVDGHPVNAIRIGVCATGTTNSGKHVSFCGFSPWVHRPAS
jgi:hypothetical protein